MKTRLPLLSRLFSSKQPKNNTKASTPQPATAPAISTIPLFTETARTANSNVKNFTECTRDEFEALLTRLKTSAETSYPPHKAKQIWKDNALALFNIARNTDVNFFNKPLYAGDPGPGMPVDIDPTSNFRSMLELFVRAVETASANPNAKAFEISKFPAAKKIYNGATDRTWWSKFLNNYEDAYKLINLYNNEPKLFKNLSFFGRSPSPNTLAFEAFIENFRTISNFHPGLLHVAMLLENAQFIQLAQNTKLITKEVNLLDLNYTRINIGKINPLLITDHLSMVGELNYGNTSEAFKKAATFGSFIDRKIYIQNCGALKILQGFINDPNPKIKDMAIECKWQFLKSNEAVLDRNKAKSTTPSLEKPRSKSLDLSSKPEETFAQNALKRRNSTGNLKQFA